MSNKGLRLAWLATIVITVVSGTSPSTPPCLGHDGDEMASPGVPDASDHCEASDLDEQSLLQMSTDAVPSVLVSTHRAPPKHGDKAVHRRPSKLLGRQGRDDGEVKRAFTELLYGSVFLALLVLAFIGLNYVCFKYRDFIEEEDKAQTYMYFGEEADAPIDGPAHCETGPLKAAGTKGRMARLPPTAAASLGASFFRKPVSSLIADPRQHQPDSGKLSADSDPKGCGTTASPLESDSVRCTLSMGSVSSTGSIVPPPIISDFESAGNDDTWTIQHQMLKEFVLGSLIEIEGLPPLYARLAGNSQLELGRSQTLDKAEVTIGPLSDQAGPPLAAEILGPAGEVYGSFIQNGDGFAVHHSARGCVLTLDPVRTSKGLFLEMAAEDGHPICLARLNESDGAGVEIEAHPDVDASLIVSCVLATFIARPSLLEGIAQAPSPA